jgi:DNA invertase Pin-like site-specific DNA recombinase
MKPKPKVAVGYVRVSTGDQVEGISLAAQRTKIRQYAKLHGLRLLEIVSDDGKSAKTFERAGLQKLFHLIDSSDIDFLIVAKLDRATRGGAGALDYFLGRLKKRGVELVSIAENLDTGSASGLLFARLLALIAQWEREIISERTRDALEELRLQGKRRSRRAPLGYRFLRGRVVQDPREIKTIREATRLYRSRSHSMQRVGEILESRGLRTREGLPYGVSGVQRLIAAGRVLRKKVA